MPDHDEEKSAGQQPPPMAPPPNAPPLDDPPPYAPLPGAGAWDAPVPPPHGPATGEPGDTAAQPPAPGAPPAPGSVPPGQHGEYLAQSSSAAVGGNHRDATRPGMRPSVLKPGIIPLRALGVGEVLEGSFQAIRVNPKGMIGLALIINTVTALIAGVIGVLFVGVVIGLGDDLFGMRSDTFFGDSMQDIAALLGLWGLGFLIFLVLVTLSYALISIASTLSVGQSSLGRKASMGWLWKNSRRHLLSVLGYVVLTSVAATVAFGVFAGFAVFSAVTLDSGPSIAAVVVLFLLLSLLTLVVSVFLTFAVPVIVFERVGPIKAIGRSFSLVKKGFWRLLLVLFLAYVIMQVVLMVVLVPIQIFAPLVLTLIPAGGGASGEASIGIVLLVLSQAIQFIASAIVQPFFTAVVALMYLDARMRFEALDVTLLQSVANAEGPARGSTS